ncbi:hypothetical protein C5748_26600 [Phyllobacterium phragmitis]|uniref:inorganic diphosphatase n=1 Tax=Phyllobacterium phragmitis TaxID=2670329 RepID=A0A2S9IJ06_9HYPH|nr:inorganic diphosphatase [Phyllobacterium phragmitis]PRD40510.1 hypothetical protein C5748_26600 [Phyllobacterium phragmitis]
MSDAMIEHCYSVGSKAPVILNIVIEIPATDAMTQKLEVDLSDCTVISAGEVYPPVPIYWHYGCIPQTLDSEGEALDIILLMDETCVSSGDEIEVRPIGVARITDGWEIQDDKIIAVRNTKQHALIREINDLPPVTTVDDKRISFKDAVADFFKQYRAEGGIIHSGWGNSREARAIIENGLKKYHCVPLAKDKDSAHIFPLYQHIFIPPPPRHYGETHFLEEIEQVRSLYENQEYHSDYGYIISGAALKTALRQAGYKVGRSRLRGHNRAAVIDERLRIADCLIRYGVKVFTASNDLDWLEKAEARGVATAQIEHEEYDVENVAGISALDLWTIHYQRADGTHIAVVEHDVDTVALKERLLTIGIAKEDEACHVLNVPDRLIPWEVPARGGKRITQVTNWIDYGFNIWPDKQNRPYLVIGDAVRKIAEAQGRRRELDAFVKRCEREFDGVHFLKLAEGQPYGSPTNSIDVGMAIISNSSLVEKSRLEMQEVLQRPIDNSLHLTEDAPGLRCAVFPVDKPTYTLLQEGDPLHHLSIDRNFIDPLDPMDAFFDVFGPEHRELVVRLKDKRQAMGEALCVQNAVTLRRRSPVAHNRKRFS